MQGKPGTSSRMGLAASGLPSRIAAIHPEPHHRTSPASPLINRASTIQRPTEGRTPFPSATRRVTAKLTPEVQAVTASEKMEKIS